MQLIHSLPKQLLLAALAVALLALPLPGADDPKPTREAFINEVLDAKPTPVTPKFNDFTPGSYHVKKEDLLKGLIEEAKKRKLTLRAVTILGPLPADPLWTSYVAVFLQDGEKVRVNSLVMPHARITSKATALLTADQYKKWRDGVIETGALKKEPQAADAKKDKPTAFGEQLLLVVWSDDGKTQEVYGGAVVQAEKSEKLMEYYNAVLKELKETYPEKDK